MTSALLVELPEQIVSARLVMRAPRAGDGPAINRAVVESFAELHPWMPWARTLPSITESEEFARDAQVKFLQREELPLLLFRAADGELVGASGMHHIDWTVPRFEIGYWCRTSCVGSGYTSEAVAALCRFLFVAFGAKRVEVRTDERNERSARVPERLGFRLEGTLRHDALGNDGAPRNTRVYSVVSIDELCDERP